MDLAHLKNAKKTCSASTTASNSTNVDKFDGEVMCDWMNFRHDYPIESPTKAIESGKTLKIDKDGVIQYVQDDFTRIHCSSSDTSIVLKCDGAHLWFRGNVGRFQEYDNLTGLSVIECFEKAIKIINDCYPQVSTNMIGTIQRKGSAAECGTYLTRLDLTSNFYTDSFMQLNQVWATRRINQRVPVVGKYGATWGYESKRAQYWKAKLYDKDAELNGKRTPTSGATTARFEVQLGSEYLRQYGLQELIKWKRGMDMENIIYGKFANQLLIEQSTAEDWTDYPPRLRQHAIMWRDGIDPRTYLKKSGYYKVRKELLEHGLDISSPCNVMTLTQKAKIVQVNYAPTLRAA